MLRAIELTFFALCAKMITMMNRKVTKAKICGCKTAARGISAVRGFVIAFLCMCVCAGAGGCASKNDTEIASDSASETPLDDTDDDSENASGAGENENRGGEENGTGEDTGDTKDDSAGGSSDTGDDSDTTSGDETREEKRFAEYYADGKLIRRCKIAEIGNEILDEPAVPEKAGYHSGEWIEVASKKNDTICFEARYTAIIYTITYYPNRGTAPDDSVPNEYTAEDCVELYIPVKTNFVFCGWYTEKDFIHKIERIERGSTGNLYLYAKWEKTS